MKRLIVLGPAVLVLAVTGCGSSGSTTSPSAASTPGATPSSVATSAPSPSRAAPSAGASLARVSGPGCVNVVANVQGQGFDVVDSVLDDNYTLDIKTGARVWKTNIGDGALCDLTSRQVLVNTNDQLATLSARTGKQLSYQNDPYQDDTGEDSCPGTVANGITGVGYANSQVTQLLEP